MDAIAAAEDESAEEDSQASIGCATSGYSSDEDAFVGLESDGENAAEDAGGDNVAGAAASDFGAASESDYPDSCADDDEETLCVVCQSAMDFSVEPQTGDEHLQCDVCEQHLRPSDLRYPCAGGCDFDVCTYAATRSLATARRVSAPPYSFSPCWRRRWPSATLSSIARWMPTVMAITGLCIARRGNSSIARLWVSSMGTWARGIACVSLCVLSPRSALAIVRQGATVCRTRWQRAFSTATWGTRKIDVLCAVIFLHSHTVSCKRSRLRFITLWATVHFIALIHPLAKRLVIVTNIAGVMESGCATISTGFADAVQP